MSLKYQVDSLEQRKSAFIEIVILTGHILGKPQRETLQVIFKDNFSNFVDFEQNEIENRLKSLVSFNKSFYIEKLGEENSYTYIFSNSLADVFGKLESIYELERSLLLFDYPAETLEANAFYSSIASRIQDFLNFIFRELSKFFEVNIPEFIADNKKMFILIDQPYLKKQQPNKIERPDMNKLEVFVFEFSQILKTIHTMKITARKEISQKIGNEELVNIALSKNELLNDLEMIHIEKSNHLRSFLEILMKLYLTLSIRESISLSYIFHSSKEIQCVIDLSKEILKASFGSQAEKIRNGVFGKHNSTDDLPFHHEDLDFTGSCDWLYTIFNFLEQVCINTLWSSDRNSIIATLSFIFNTIINSDLKNLMIKLGEMAVRKELFYEDGFAIEENSLLFTAELSDVKELIKSSIEEKKPKRDSRRIFNNHNLMFAVFVNLYDVLCGLINRLRDQLSIETDRLIQITGSTAELAMIKSCIDDLEVASKDCFAKKKEILSFFSENLMNSFCNIQFDKFRLANLSTIRHCEVHYFDKMLEILTRGFKLFGIYLNEENFLVFMLSGCQFLLSKTRELILNKTYNFQGGLVAKQEYEKVKSFCLDHCEMVDEINQMNLIIELLTSIDQDYFDNFANFSKLDLTLETIETLRKCRTDLA